MKRAGLIYDDIFLQHIPPDMHPESPHRLNAIMRALAESGIRAKLNHLQPCKAAFDVIGYVHEERYIERIRSFRPGYFDADTYIAEGTLDAALYAAGAVVRAVDSCRDGVVERVFCAVRPPGHHAESDRAMGFCIFNNAAVGARYAQKAGFEKIFIIDFDVHHGNGTEQIFYGDDMVFYFSTHQSHHYPGTGSERDTGTGKGEGYTFNIPMPQGADDEEYGVAYNETLHELVRSFDPDLIIVSAGYDIHINDPLAGINVTGDGIRSIVRGILGAKREVPVIFTLEGGYNLSALAESVLITIEEML